MRPTRSSFHQRYCSLWEAATLAGFKWPGSFRAKFLADMHSRTRLGAIYVGGILFLSREAVETLIQELDWQRRNAGNWRLKNLGVHARQRRDSGEQI